MTDDLTSTLSRELAEQAHAMDGSTLHLTDIKGRARSIRRRRTATAVAGAAAALALITPIAVIADHTGGSRNNPMPPATQDVSPSPTPPAGHQPAPGALDVSDLPTGDAPRVEYLSDGNVLRHTDGSMVSVDTTFPISSFAVLADGTHLWVTAHNGTPYVEVQDPQGHLHDPMPSGWAVSVNKSHTVGAWVRPDGQVMTWNAGATEPVAYRDPVPASDDLRIGPVLGDGCGPRQSCEVHVNVSERRTGAWQPWLVDVNGTQPLLDGGYRFLADSSESGLSIGQTEITDSGSCSTLLGGGEFQGFQTCQHTLESFSPDGNLILGTPAYQDGVGNGEIAMYNLRGTMLFNRHSTAKTQAHYPRAEWEDGTHVLAPVFQDGQWSIVRIASDGSMEYAVPPVPGQDVEAPFILPTN
ncbi:MAG: hypothetical protein J2P22_08630 [Nocardioides sp.]|nr:hypothetical protein [Nocardioides sp.]